VPTRQQPPNFKCIINEIGEPAIRLHNAHDVAVLALQGLQHCQRVGIDAEPDTFVRARRAPAHILAFDHWHLDAAKKL
jgi:hypothetical protein